MVLLVVMIAMGLALGVVWRRLGPVYAGYTGTCLLLCLWSPQVGQPLTSLDRYTLTIFPVWMVLGEWLAAHRRARLATYGVCAGLLGFLTFQVAGWAFVA
jgi:hypothetical protein